jgi:hypothetical protein
VVRLKAASSALTEMLAEEFPHDPIERFGLLVVGEMPATIYKRCTCSGDVVPNLIGRVYQEARITLDDKDWALIAL